MLSIIIVKAKQEKNAFSLNSAPAELIQHKNKRAVSISIRRWVLDNAQEFN